MASLPLRQIEGKYEILEKIKEGGMGAIYKVRHLLLDEIRVVKVIRPQIADSKDLQRRFAREARAAIRLKHPNIAQLYDFAVEPDGVAYMVMEFIDGVTLQEMLARNGPAQIDLTLEIARQGLQALRYLHLQGYVHRDIAPDNLMLSKDYDGRPLVKLIDLGIVKHLEGAGEGLTATGMFLGKVRYSSPEQFSGEKGVIDSRSDLYSFGVMLYELLTGKCPILGENLSQLVAAHLFQPPLSFEQTDPEHRVPQDIRDVVLRALQKSPEKRLATAQEFYDLLSRRPPAETLNQHLDDTLSVTISLRRQESERPPAGTTQDKLDAQFGLVRTPGPGVGLRAVDAGGAADDEDTVQRLLGDAQRMVEERQWESARRTIYRALAIHPDHAEARRLLSSAESSLAQAIAAEKERQQGIANAVESIEALLRSEQLEQGIAALEAARSTYGEDGRFTELLTRIAELRGVLAERERQVAISRAVASIDELLRQESAAEARTALAAAVAAHGTESRFTELARRTERLAAALEERRRKQAVAARCASIGELLAQENAEEAARVLEAARSELGENARFAQLHSDLAALRAVLAERERQAALEENLASIASALREEDLESAATALQSAVARFGSEERLALLGAEVDRLRRRLAERERREREKRRREQALDHAATTIGALLEREAADDAAEALAEARRELGDDIRLVELERRLLEVRERVAERRRREEIAAAVGEIEGRLDAEAPDAAQRLLEAAIVALGEDERLIGSRERIAALRRELAEKERREAIAQAIAQIEQRLRAEQIDEATDALKRAEEVFGGEPALVALRNAAVELRRVLEARARTAALAEVQATARSLTAGEQFDEAERMLAVARHQHGGDPVLDRLAQHIAGARQECEERRRAREEETRREQEARAREEEARVKREQEARAKLEEEARAKREQEARAKLEQEARAKLEQEARAKREEEARVKREQEARAKREEEARVKREQEARAKREEEARAKLEQEARAKREEEARAKLEQEARAKREEEARVKREQEARAKLEEEARVKREQEARAKLEQQARAKREKEARAKLEQEARAKREEEARAQEQHSRTQQLPTQLGAERRWSRTWGMAAAATMAGLALVGGVLWWWSGTPAPSRSAEVASVGEVPASEVTAPGGAIGSPQPRREEPAALLPASEDRAAPQPSEPATAGRDDGVPRADASRSTADETRAGSTTSPTRPSERIRDPEPATSAPKQTAVASAPRKAELPPPVPLPVEELRQPTAATKVQSRTGSPEDSPPQGQSDVTARSGQAAPPAAPESQPPQQKPSTSTGESTLEASNGSREGGVGADKGDSVVVPPLLKSVPQPRLPALAERQHRQAVVLVRVLVDESGIVLEAEVQNDDSDKKIFFEEALRVARKATFEPGTRDGVKSRMYSTIPVQFRPRG